MAQGDRGTMSFRDAHEILWNRGEPERGRETRVVVNPEEVLEKNGVELKRIRGFINRLHEAGKLELLSSYARVRVHQPDQRRILDECRSQDSDPPTSDPTAVTTAAIMKVLRSGTVIRRGREFFVRHAPERLVNKGKARDIPLAITLLERVDAEGGAIIWDPTTGEAKLLSMPTAGSVPPPAGDGDDHAPSSEEDGDAEQDGEAEEAADTASDPVTARRRGRRPRAARLAAEEYLGPKLGKLYRLLAAARRGTSNVVERPFQACALLHRPFFFIKASQTWVDALTDILL